MHTGYTSRKIKALRERGRKMANARWAQHRARLDAAAPAIALDLAQTEAINLPRRQNDPIGSLQWHDFRTGKIHRWTVEIGDRADRLVLRSPDGRRTRSHGWTWILDHLRPFLANHRKP
jgi:hypothetical protein